MSGWRSNLTPSKALRRLFHPRLSWRNTFQGDYVLEDVHSYNFDRRQLILYLDPCDLVLHSEDESIEPGVEYMMVNKFRKNLNIAASMAVEVGEPILVDMSSMGGDWEAGIAVGTALMNCPVPVTVLARRAARSMSSIIPLFADKFVLDLSAKYMIHRGSYCFGGPDQLACTEDLERRKCTELMLQIYINRLKSQGIHKRKQEKTIRDILKRLMEKKIDVWLDPAEAVEIGFVDEVFDGDWGNLRTRTINTRRRERMRAVLNAKIEVDVTTYCKDYETDIVEG